MAEKTKDESRDSLAWLTGRGKTFRRDGKSRPLGFFRKRDQRENAPAGRVDERGNLREAAEIGRGGRGI